MKTIILLTAVLSVYATQSFAQNEARPVHAVPGEDGYRPMQYPEVAGAVSAPRRLLHALDEVRAGNAWRNETRYTYSYMEDGHGYIQHHERWNTAINAWEPSRRYHYTFNDNGTKAWILLQLWNDVAGDWMNSQQWTYEYTAAGAMSALQGDDWRFDKWQPSYRESYAYDDRGYLISTIRSDWNFDTHTWDYHTQMLYTNNSDGTPRQYVEQRRNLHEATWRNVSRVVFTYDAANRSEDKVTERWIGSDWAPSYSAVRAYDAEGYLLRLTLGDWDPTIGTWYYDNRYLYTNNEEGNTTLLIEQNLSGEEWMDTYRMTLMYESASGVADTRSDEALHIYPNPGRKLFTVLLGDEPMRSPGTVVQVCNVLGDVVMQIPAAAPELRLDLSGRPAGMYIVRILAGGNRLLMQRKVVVTE